MNGPRTVKIQCFDERGLPSYTIAKFPAHTLARFSRKGADEQGVRNKNPSNTFDIHVDCSVDIFEMIIRWMRANETVEDVPKWSHIETPRHDLTIRQRAKLYQVALYHFKVVHGAERVRVNLVNAIENKHDDAFTAEDIQYLKNVLDQDSNLLVKIDKAVAKQFVLGWTHDDEVAKVQAWTGSRREDTKMGHLVQEYIQGLRKAGRENRVRRDRWQDARWNFPHINMGLPAPAAPAPAVAAPPPKNPWGTVAGVPAVERLFGSSSTSSLPKYGLGGGLSTAMGPPPKPAPCTPPSSSKLATFTTPTSSKPAPCTPPSASKPATFTTPTSSKPASPEKSGWPYLRPSSPSLGLLSPSLRPSSPSLRPSSPSPRPSSLTKVAHPKGDDEIPEDTKTEISGYLDSGDTLSTQGQGTNERAIEAWQAAQHPPPPQPTPRNPKTEAEWRTFTSTHITIQKLEETLAHGSLHQTDFPRFSRLYHDLIDVEFWATYNYVRDSSHVPMAKEYAFYRTASQTMYLNGMDDWMVYHAKECVLDGFLRSVWGVGTPVGNLDFDCDGWRLVIHMIVDGHRADFERHGRRVE